AGEKRKHNNSTSSSYGEHMNEPPRKKRKKNHQKEKPSKKLVEKVVPTQDQLTLVQKPSREKHTKAKQKPKHHQINQASLLVKIIPALMSLVKVNLVKRKTMI
ncbi:MAG: hypothetical protein AAF380_02160, partial [Bacteroidota bacterium]